MIENTINNSKHSLKGKENEFPPSQVVIQTNWFAIAGSVSSGKTTLVKKITDYYGFRNVTDHARDVIAEALNTGMSHDEFLKNRQFHQDKIAERFINACCGLDAKEVVIHDYGLPCVHGFYTANGLSENQNLKRACQTFRYKKVFLVSPLDMVDDTVRIVSDFQRAIYFEIAESYKSFGYQVIPVPSFYRDREKSIAARFEFVKDQINRSIAQNKKLSVEESKKTEVFA